MRSGNQVADFTSPPLDEVVLGVQFNPPSRYSTVDAGDIWKLFASEFPIVSEQQRLPPQFEVFGGVPPGQFQIDFGPPDLRNRLWFVAEDDSHLLQFQDDRLLLNWRRRTSGIAYPRHERMAALFAEYLQRLDQHLRSHLDSFVAINQAEISYINIIPITNLDDVGEWIKIFDFASLDLEGFNSVMAEVVLSKSKQPIGRLIHEAQSVWSVDGKSKAVRLTLTFRGKPSEDKIDSAIEFLALGRELIVNRFCAMTSDAAHEIWGRQR